MTLFIRYDDVLQILENHPGLILNPGGLRRCFEKHGSLSLGDLLTWQSLHYMPIKIDKVLQPQPIAAPPLRKDEP